MSSQVIRENRKITFNIYFKSDYWSLYNTQYHQAPTKDHLNNSI